MTDWCPAQYLIFGAFFYGIGTGCWYVAESGAIMTLAPERKRGKYLAFWIVSRNLGQLVGGAIKWVFSRIVTYCNPVHLVRG